MSFTNDFSYEEFEKECRELYESLSNNFKDFIQRYEKPMSVSSILYSLNHMLASVMLGHIEGGEKNPAEIMSLISAQRSNNDYLEKEIQKKVKFPISIDKH